MFLVSDTERVHDVVMLMRAIAAADAANIVASSDCAKKIAIISAGMPCEDRLVINDFCLKKFSDFDDHFIPMRDKQDYPSLAQVKKIPIPAQCLKASKNIKIR